MKKNVIKSETWKKYMENKYMDKNESKKYLKNLILSGISLILFIMLIIYKIEKTNLTVKEFIIIFIWPFLFSLIFVYNLYAIINPNNYFIKRRDRLSDPAKKYIVTMTDEEIIVKYNNEKLDERVRWDDLQSIEIITTDEGPFKPDFFYLLNGSSGGCSIPLGATNFEVLFDKLQKLPNFNNEAIIIASSSITNDRFEVWRNQ
jgi:hypothetical protein